MAKSPFYNVIIEANQRNITDLISGFKFTDSIESDNVLKFDINGVDPSLSDESDFSEGTIIIFNFGYISGQTSKKRRARISNIAYSYRSMFSMSIEAVDLGIILKKNSNARVFKELTGKEIIENIVATKNMVVEFFSNIDLTTTFNKIYPIYPQGNKSDMKLIEEITSREKDGKFISYVEDNKLKVKPRELKSKPLRKFRWNDPDGDVISFKPMSRDTGRDISSKVTVTAGVDPDTGELIEQEIDVNSETGEVFLGKKDWAYDNNKNRSVVQSSKTKDDSKDVKRRVAVKAESEEEYKNVASKIKQDASMGDLTASLEIEGDPSLNADQLITMSGVAKKHVGNWYITTIVHSVGGDYTSELALSKNASALSNKVGGNKIPDSKVNNKQGDETSSNTKEVPWAYNNDGGIRSTDPE